MNIIECDTFLNELFEDLGDIKQLKETFKERYNRDCHNNTFDVILMKKYQRNEIIYHMLPKVLVELIYGYIDDVIILLITYGVDKETWNGECLEHTYNLIIKSKDVNIEFNNYEFEYSYEFEFDQMKDCDKLIVNSFNTNYHNFNNMIEDISNLIINNIYRCLQSLFDDYIRENNNAFSIYGDTLKTYKIINHDMMNNFILIHNTIKNSILQYLSIN